MKILAWVLGLLAVFGSCSLGYNWAVARKGLRKASVATAKYADDVSTWESVVRLERRHAESEVENGELVVKSDILTIQIAELQGGRGMAAARTNLLRDRALLSGDKMMLSLVQMNATLGEDSRVSASRERLEAATASGHVYAGCLSRDEKLIYGLGMVWLAFGFALALAGGAKSSFVLKDS